LFAVFFASGQHGRAKHGHLTRPESRNSGSPATQLRFQYAPSSSPRNPVPHVDTHPPATGILSENPPWPDWWRPEYSTPRQSAAMP